MLSVQAYCFLCGHQVMAISHGNGVLHCAICGSRCYGKEVYHVTSIDTPEPEDISQPPLEAGNAALVYGAQPEVDRAEVVRFHHGGAE